jgi:hypothetical protein
MTKIEQIEEAIEKAIRRESKLTPLSLSVPMLGSLQIRHLLNNLGAISTSFIDVGSHVGGSYCSAVFKNNNLKDVAAIDSWESDITEGHNHEQHFRENAVIFTPANVDDPTIMQIIKSDAFKVDLSLFDGQKVDFFSYDAGHSREQQKQALIYYKPILADEFIYCCDDWAFDGVKEGTLEGIEDGGYEILYQRELLNDNGELYQNEQWWDNYAVFLLKKKQ